MIADGSFDGFGQADGCRGGPLNNKQHTRYSDRRLNRLEALATAKRRTKAAGLGDRYCNHTFRGTSIRAYLSNDGQLERAQYIAGHASPKTTKLYDRREEEATLDEVERIIR